MAKSDISRFYNKKGIGDTSRKGYYEEKISFFCSVMEKYKKNNLQILDIACNDGELTKKYTKYGQVLGIDINKAAIAICKKNGLNCKVGDVSSLKKLYKNHFDIVIAGDIIEHIFDTDLFLQDIYAVLKKGGILLLTTPNVASLGRRIMLLLGYNPFIEYSTKLPYEEFNVGHIRYYTKENLKSQLNFFKFNEVTIYGDKINITSSISLPFNIAKMYPAISRNLMVIAKK